MGLSSQGLIRGLVSRLLPTGSPDSSDNDTAARLGSWHDLKVESVYPTKHLLADEGTYMVASMAPGATSLQLGLSAAFSPTAVAIAFQNSAQEASPAIHCFPDYIRMLVATAPTSAVQLLYATVLDDKDRTPTTISNAAGTNPGQGPGTPATVTAYRSPAACTNMDVAQAVVGVPYFPLSASAGAPPTIPSAGANARTICGNVPLRAQIPVALDEYVITFGNVDPSGQLVTAAPAGASRVVSHHPAVVIGPGHWFLFYLWAPSNATAGIAFSGLEMGWIER